MHKKPAIHVLLIFGSILASPLRAETVVLTNGQTMEGAVIYQNADYLDLVVKFGKLRINLRKVERVEADSSEKAAERLAKTAAENALEEQMRSEGKVQYRGAWVALAEKLRIESEQAVAKEKIKRESIQATAIRKADELRQLAERRKHQNAATASYANNRYGQNQRAGRNQSNNSRNANRSQGTSRNQYSDGTSQNGRFSNNYTRRAR